MADYIYRGTRTHGLSSMGVPPAKRISTPAGQRLSVIMENGPSAPPPSHPHQHIHPAFRGSRRFSKLSRSDDPPRHSYEKSPPAYSVWSDISKQEDSRVNSWKNNKHIAKRGGWKRLGLIFLVVVVIVVALAVGLTVGLNLGRKSNKSSSPSPPSAPTSSPSAGGSQFPLGSYSIQVFLDTVATNCTSNPNTWRCYPYATYNDNPTQAMATFNWIVSSTGQNGQLQISSTDNPLAIMFSNQALQLTNQGQDSEHYSFQFPMDKQVIPSSAITDDGSSATCFYNGTIFQAYLYTKMAKTLPSTAPSSTAGSSPDWPYAVRVEQVIGGGGNVPNCYKTNNGIIGESVTDGFTAQDAGSLCSCLYKNWRTPGKYKF